MSDRKEFQAARDAGLAIRQQRRIETREELRCRTRREVAEEIAAKLDGFAADPHGTNGEQASSAFAMAAGIAREIGTR